MRCSPILFSPVLAMLLAACAQTPNAPVTASPDTGSVADTRSLAVQPGDDAQLIGEVLNQVRSAMASQRTGSEAATHARIQSATQRLEEAAMRCEQQSNCDTRPYLVAYQTLLALQSEHLERLAGDLSDPPRDGRDMVSGELGLSSIVTSLPEAGRTINLLNGEELSNIIGLNGPIQAGIEDWLTWMRPNLLEAWENYQFMRHLMWPSYEEAGLPEALLFGILAKESGGKVHAVSRAGASGPLQFMPATGRRYGLGSVNGFDQRFDPQASTRANVAYLNDQFRLLNNNLELVLAAYNGGENRVRRLVQSTGKSRFWDDEIYWSLPRETREYVPMVLAAAWLFMHPEDYRLEFPTVDTRATRIDLQREIALSELAVCLGQSGSRAGWFRVLRNLNAQMNPSERQPAGTEIAIPAQLVPIYQSDCVDGPFAQLAASLHDSKRPSGPELVNYVVQRGDTLSSIARSRRCANVRQIADLNSIPPPSYPLRAGQRLRIPQCS